MTAVYTSRVWDCWDATYEALAAAAWTAHPTTLVVPTVRYAGARDVHQEMITVPGMKPPAGPAQDYATLGVVGRDETFTLYVELWSEVPGFIDATRDADPSRAVRNRLRDMNTIVESTFRDQTTGRPKGITILNVWKHEITAVHPGVYPLPNGGYGGIVTYELTFTARI